MLMGLAGSHVTRFIALAEVGNAAKQKSLHALNVQPAVEMEAATLQQKPAGSTPCPYTTGLKRPLEADVQDQVTGSTFATIRQRLPQPIPSSRALHKLLASFWPVLLADCGMFTALSKLHHFLCLFTAANAQIIHENCSDVKPGEKSGTRVNF